MPENDINITKARVKDAAEILKLQKTAYLSEAALYNDYTIPPLVQTLTETREDFKNYIILKAVSDGVIIGSVRGQLTEDNSCYIGRLMVYPDYQKRGLGSRLMQAIQDELKQAKRYILAAGQRSEDNIRLYQKLGFRQYSTERMNDKVIIVHMEKRNK
jgi:ribosomal protein S18 acetylase RimI-like enzyme